MQPDNFRLQPHQRRQDLDGRGRARVWLLQNLWAQGGLAGANASDAFTVACGLGSTMTGTDILEGYLLVTVLAQVIRPGEFIELTFKQKMQP